MTRSSRPDLPPPGGAPVRVFGLSGAVVRRHHPDTLGALVDAADPDVVVAAPPESTVVSSLGHDVDPPVLTPGRGVAPAVAYGPDDGVVVALLDATGGTAPRCVVSDALSLSVDPYERSAAVEGLADYRERLPDPWHAAAAHVVTTLRAGHETTVTGPTGPLSLVGVGTTTARLGAGVDSRVGDPTVVSVYSNGAVTTEPVDPESVGLRGVRDVGPARAETLREGGYTTVGDLAQARAPDIADLGGFGRSTARSIRAAARAGTDRTVVSTGDGALPRGDPVFVDVETDGLEASTAWLVGVLDGGPEDGRYLAFRQRDPDDTSHLEGHCPDQHRAWADTYQFDPLYWARDQGNAALPGRSNRLEAVAGALGWEPTTAGLDGQTVAEVYVAWRTAVERAADPAAVDPPAWRRLERYCEDDVRALATIYDELRAAAGRDATAETAQGGNGRQGSLSDFG